MGLWYPKGSSFELTAFSYADHAGCIDSRKSTSGGIQFLVDKLVSWMSKKQNYTAMSLAEAKYMALSASCAQVMLMRTQLQDYGFNYNKIPLYCDSQSATSISCNPVQHSRTKHIHTRSSYALSWKPCQGDSLNLPDHSHTTQALISLCGFDEHEIVRILAGQLFMVVAMAKCGRMVESENHSPRQPLQVHPRLEVLRLYERLDSYAYAFTCVPMEDMCSAATAPNGYQALESSTFHFVSFEILQDYVASRWYNTPELDRFIQSYSRRLLPLNSVFRSFFEKQKFTGPNFIDWYRQLCLVLSTEDKENYLEHLIPEAPVAPPGQQVPHVAAAAYAAWELKAMFSKQAEQELLQTGREFHTCKQEEGQSVSSYILKMKNYHMHGMGKTVNELHAMLKMHKDMMPKKDANLALHAIRAGRGLRGSKNLKPCVLSLYVGDGHREAVEAIGTYHLELLRKYVSCMSRKMARKPYSHQVERAKDLLGLIHTDEVFETFKVFQKEVENQLGKTIKSLRFDRGGEYMSQEFLDHLKEHGIIAHRIPNYTPQYNGVSDRRNRTLLDMVRSMNSQTTLPKSFWDYALETAAHILNMVPTKKINKTPYEIWHGQAPKLSYLKVWDCEALVKRDTLTKPDKLDPRSYKCIFVGYPKETMRYSFYSLSENKVFIARKAEFFENDLIDLKASRSVEDLKLIQEEDTNLSFDTSLDHEEDDQEINEPQTVLLDPESKKWLDAMNVNDVWVLVELPPNERTVGSKWLFKKKTNMDGAVYVFKARLVVKGFTQTYGVDYEETFSPVADIRAIRILIVIAAYYDYEKWQIDVKTAFLNGHLSKEVYMEQPEGFVNQKYPNHNITSRLQQNLGEEHWNILKYLRNTKDMFLVYGGNMERELRVSCYTDAGYLTDADDLKSQTGYVFVLNGGAVNWKKVVWIRKFISVLGIVPTIELISMYCDNTGAIAIAKDDGVAKGARHFRVKVHYLRETIKLGDVKIEKVDTDDNLADPFTKDLVFPKHSELTRNIRMLPASSFM
nr:hypothetical protein [Tanacetum cinerariifolium]